MHQQNQKTFDDKCLYTKKAWKKVTRMVQAQPDDVLWWFKVWTVYWGYW